MKSTTITLAGRGFQVRKFNIGELEDIAELTSNAPKHKLPFEILRLALGRAEPPLDAPAVRALDADPTEFGEAIRNSLVKSVKLVKDAGIKLDN